MEAQIVREALKFAMAHNSVKSWERFYDLAYRYYGGKVSRKDLEATVYRRLHRGAIREAGK